MLQLTPQMRILVALEAVDGRKGVDGLAQLCREKLASDPFSGCVCGQIFTAAEPETAGPDKYDAPAVAMIALLKYGTGVPFKRLERLED